MAGSGPQRVEPEQVDAFRRDGAVCVRRAFTPEQVELVEQGIERTLAAPSARAIAASRPQDMDAEARWFPDGSLADMPDVEADRSAFEIVGWDLDPGDAVFFHMLTLHAAGGAEPGRRRRAFSLRFMGDDVKHAPRRWRTSPEFPGLADELPAGAPMRGPLFPLLWEAPSGRH